MIIVSQNKQIITERIELSVENISGEEKAKKIMLESENGKLYELGKYENEERAIEVLKAITATYQASKIFENAGSSCQNQMADKYLKTGTEPFKYEMPKE